jgi:hypothetical protein
VAVIPDNFAQVNLRFGGAGYPTGAEVTFGVSRSGFVGNTEDIAEAVRVAWDANLRPVTPELVTLLTILVKEGPNVDGPSFELGVNAPGTGESEEVNPQSALLVQKRTAGGGRRNRGRMYYPLTENDVTTGGGILSTSLPAFQTGFTDFQGDLAAADLPMVILHNTSTPAPTTVTVLSVQPRAATQRRRLRR